MSTTICLSSACTSKTSPAYAFRFQVFQGESGREVIYAKPYDSMERGELVLLYVPVPRALLTRDTVPAEDAPHVNWRPPYAPLRRIVRKLGMRDLIRTVIKRHPAPVTVHGEFLNFALR